MEKSTPKNKRISKHFFRLRDKNQIFIKGEVLVNFTPLLKRKGIQIRSIIPTYNNDLKHYSMAFRLPSAEPDNDQQLKQDHQRRVVQSQLQIAEIMYPKPRSRHRYCGVCRGYYQDYKEHLESEQHNNCLKKSGYQRLIIEFCEKYRAGLEGEKEDQKNNQSMSEDLLSKCFSTETIGDSIKSQEKLFQVVEIQ